MLTWATAAEGATSSFGAGLKEGLLLRKSVSRRMAASCEVLSVDDESRPMAQHARVTLLLLSAELLRTGPVAWNYSLRLLEHVKSGNGRIGDRAAAAGRGRWSMFAMLSARRPARKPAC